MMSSMARTEAKNLRFNTIMEDIPKFETGKTKEVFVKAKRPRDLL